jgi:FkbM family methyltransferase
LSLFRDYIAHSLIGTPLESPLRSVRHMAQLPQRVRHPELREIYAESDRIEMVLERAVEPSMNCIDVGCHLGAVLDRFVRLAPRGQHIAIEPVPYKARWLRRKFPEVTVIEAALGAEAGQAEFYLDTRQSGFGGLRPHVDARIEQIRVEMRRLDDVVPPGRRVGFLKLDVEGAETDVILGGARVLTESRPVVLFECAASHLQAFARTPASVFRLFTERHGYAVYRLKDWLAGAGPLDLAAFERAAVYPFEAFNFLAVPIRPMPTGG